MGTHCFPLIWRKKRSNKAIFCLADYFILSEQHCSPIYDIFIYLDNVLWSIFLYFCLTEGSAFTALSVSVFRLYESQETCKIYVQYVSVTPWTIFFSPSLWQISVSKNVRKLCRRLCWLHQLLRVFA